MSFGKIVGSLSPFRKGCAKVEKKWENQRQDILSTLLNHCHS
jgi:hypothetical protein